MLASLTGTETADGRPSSASHDGLQRRTSRSVCSGRLRFVPSIGKFRILEAGLKLCNCQECSLIVINIFLNVCTLLTPRVCKVVVVVVLVTLAVASSSVCISCSGGGYEGGSDGDKKNN